MAKMRGFRGINVHLALLHPSDVMARIVLDKARTASYVPYTRGAQDVIETIFPTQVTYPAWFEHVHAQLGTVDYKLCGRLALKQLAHSEQARTAYREADERLLAQERVLIGELLDRSGRNAA